jgi:hypothetical protein
MNIALDLDGVVYDFWKAWTSKWFLALDPALDAEYNSMTLHTGMDPAAWWQWFDEVVGWQSVEQYPEAWRAISTLVRRGHRIVAVTSRPQRARADTYRQIAQFGPLFAGVVFLEDKRQFVADLYVDDNPGVIYDLQVRYGPHKVIVCSQPWNQNTDGYRISGIAELPQAIQEIESHHPSTRPLPAQPPFNTPGAVGALAGCEDALASRHTREVNPVSPPLVTVEAWGMAWMEPDLRRKVKWLRRRWLEEEKRWRRLERGGC